MSDWEEMAFSDAFQINPKVKLIKGKEYPFVDMQSLDTGARSVHSNQIREFTGGGSKFQHGDTLLARITPCLENGKIARYYGELEEEAHGSTEFIVIRGREEVTNSDYAYYAVRSPLVHQYAISQMTGTSGRQRVPTDAFDHLIISIPDLAEQQVIARILGTLDNKIELNRRMNETLEGIARALFRSWFIDFDPVRAKAEGRQLFGMDEETAALFPDQFENSELEEIPKGWTLGKLSDICTTQYGYTASAAKSPVGPKLLRVTDINKSDHIIWDDVPHCAIPDESLEKYKLAKGDLVVARMADPGKAAIIDDDTSAIFASYLVRLRTNTLACNYYVHGFLKSSVYQQYAEDVKGGSVQANMNAKVIVGCPIVIPSSAVIDAYYKIVIQIREKITSNLAINSTLYRLRDSLLPKLISGDIRVNPSKFGFGPEGEKVGEV